MMNEISGQNLALHEINSPQTIKLSKEKQEELSAITEERLQTESQSSAASRADTKSTGTVEEAAAVVISSKTDTIQLAGEENATLSISRAGQMVSLTKMESTSTTSYTYGYDKEFDSISESFKEACNTVIAGRYAGTGIDYSNIDYSVVDQMNEKYEELKTDIENNYSGEEQADRLAELEKAYQSIFTKNILRPLQNQVATALSLYHRGGVTVWHSYSSQSMVDEFNKTNADMNAVYERLEPAGESMLSLMSASWETWLDSDSVKSTLKDIISTLVLNTGTNAQMREYQSLL